MPKKAITHLQGIDNDDTNDLFVHWAQDKNPQLIRKKNFRNTEYEYLMYES